MPSLFFLLSRSLSTLPFHFLFVLTLFSLSPCLPLSLWWKIFKEHLNTRVVLVAMEIWTDKDHIPISVMPLDMLRDFSKYRQQHIKQHADAVHLFSWVCLFSTLLFDYGLFSINCLCIHTLSWSKGILLLLICRNVTFHYRLSSAAFFEGICSVSRGVGVNEVRKLNRPLASHLKLLFLFLYVVLLHCMSKK